MVRSSSKADNRYLFETSTTSLYVQQHRKHSVLSRTWRGDCYIGISASSRLHVHIQHDVIHIIVLIQLGRTIAALDVAQADGLSYLQPLQSRPVRVRILPCASISASLSWDWGREPRSNNDGAALTYRYRPGLAKPG